MVLDNNFQMQISVLNRQLFFQIVLYFQSISLLFCFNHTAPQSKECVLVYSDFIYALQDKYIFCDFIVVSRTHTVQGFKCRKCGDNPHTWEMRSSF